MSAVHKRRRPANDQPSPALPKMSYVVLPRAARWNGQKTLVIVVLVVFLAIFGIVLAANWSMFADKTQVSRAQTDPAPFDITINASELAPPEGVASFASALSQLSLRQKPLPPVLEVTVEDDFAGENMAQAAHQAEAAQKSLRQMDVRQALQFQHRAVELAPLNMLYRLDLAIIHDRLDDKAGAETLYRQVVTAYEDHDATLPSTLDIDGIRRRLDYLTAMAQR